MIAAEAALDIKYLGSSVLSVAALNGHCDILHMLIDAYANIHEKDFADRDALQWAGKSGIGSAVQLLLDANAFLDTGGDRDAALLLSAAMSGDMALLRSLLKSKMTVNVSDNVMRPLHLAAMCGNSDAVQVLIDAKATVDEKNSQKGYTTAFRCS